MAKVAQSSSKYVIKAIIDANGVVEKPDVIGAIFGQTEGLLGPELDLRELQMTGRIGRIEVDVESHGGESTAEITIPSSLNATETALVSAALETIDRVGPCQAELRIESVDDVRVAKREYIVDRAKEILDDMQDTVPESRSISKEIKTEVRTGEITEHQGLPAGPEIEESDGIVLVEGRADVLNLLRHGVKNAIALGGTSVPDAAHDLAQEHEVTLFLDGDRGGDLIEQELHQTIDYDYVARAPSGKEVEELSKKEVYTALRDKQKVRHTDLGAQPAEIGAGRPVTEDTDQDPTDGQQDAGPDTVGDQDDDGTTATAEDPDTDGGVRSGTETAGTDPDAAPDMDEAGETSPDTRQEDEDDLEIDEEVCEQFRPLMTDLVGTRALCLVDSDLEVIERAPRDQLSRVMEGRDDVHAILIDGPLKRSIVNLADSKGVDYVVGMRGSSTGESAICLTMDDL